jgi:plastocyanin
MRIRRAATILGLALVGAAAVLVAVWLFASPGRAHATAAHGDRRAQVASTEIRIVNFDYDPNQLTVDAGTAVTWTNTANRPHTVTDRGGTFDSQPILPGHVASVKFSTPGTYFYFCRINPSRMNGTIVVRPGTQPSQVTRIQAIDPTNIAGEQLRFDPPNSTVAAGSSVLVANVGGKPHTLTADDGSFTTGIITPGPEAGRFAGSNAMVTLNQPGTYAFHCEIHPQQMRGVITVVGQPVAHAPPPASNGAQQGSVKALDFAFNPTQLSVGAGAKVTFQNSGNAPHTATFDDIDLDTRTIAPGGTAQLTAPPRPGSYSYHCSVHPAKMRGVLVVLGQNVADPAATAQPYKPVVQLARAGPGGRVSSLVLITGILGAFLAGLAIASFLRPRTRQNSAQDQHASPS